jgi:nucleoside-diphosphate-sugar epimerase
MSRLVAITGATGFLGRYIVGALAAEGWRLRILARQPIDHPQLAGMKMEVVLGDLSDRQALRALVDGADTIVHAAGLIKASSAAAFEAVNVYGTANLARAIEECKVSARVLLVSSMAAREPQLSAYARTKRAGEKLLTAVLSPRCHWTIVRPCVIYGPWDRETLTIFQAVDHHIFFRPGIANGRVAVIHAADAAAAIASLCDRGPAGSVFELADERTQGYSWDEIVSTAEAATDSKALAIPLPGLAVRAAAAVSLCAAKMLRRTPMFTPGKAREILHADWGSRVERQPPADLWRPGIGLAKGFRDTVCWYRDRHWLAARRPAWSTQPR